jgi:hypothetical protein
MFSVITKQALFVAGFIRMRWSSTLYRLSLKVDSMRGLPAEDSDSAAAARSNGPHSSLPDSRSDDE